LTRDGHGGYSMVKLWREANDQLVAAIGRLMKSGAPKPNVPSVRPQVLARRSRHVLTHRVRSW